MQDATLHLAIISLLRLLLTVTFSHTFMVFDDFESFEAYYSSVF